MKTKKGVLAVRKTAVVRKASAGVAAISAVDPQALLAQAIDKNLPIESMERLLAMRREMKAEWARDEFFAALSKFQSICPIVEKNHKVPNKDKQTTRYSYAAIEDLVEQAGPSLMECGFSWTVKPEQTDKDVTAAVYAHHKAGHEEVTKFSVPIDPAAYMSDPQKAAAALTFATRYAFKGAFGIQTKGEDNDAQQDDEPRRTAIRQPQEKGKDAPIAAHAEVKLTDYEKGLKYLTATETDPKSRQVVALFNENEKTDYTHELKEAKGKPEELAKIIADIVVTGSKRRKAVKGDAA